MNVAVLHHQASLSVLSLSAGVLLVTLYFFLTGAAKIIKIVPMVYKRCFRRVTYSDSHFGRLSVLHSMVYILLDVKDFG